MLGAFLEEEEDIIEYGVDGKSTLAGRS